MTLAKIDNSYKIPAFFSNLNPKVPGSVYLHIYVIETTNVIRVYKKVTKFARIAYELGKCTHVALCRRYIL